VAKQQPRRRFTLLYDKVCRQDILQEAWQRVKSNKGAAGVDQVDIDAIRDYGEARFLSELEQELRSRSYRAALVRRVHIPKPGQPGKTRPLGIPTVKDRLNVTEQIAGRGHPKREVVDRRQDRACPTATHNRAPSRRGSSRAGWAQAATRKTRLPDEGIR